MLGTKNKTSGRGVALISVLLMIVVLLILTGALLEGVVSEAHGAGTNAVSNQALNAAYAGIDDMVLQIEERTSGTNTGIPPQFSAPLPQNFGTQSSRYTVTVVQHWNPGANLQYFLVKSMGEAGNLSEPVHPTRIVQALVRTQPYSAYELYSISEVNNVGGTVYYTNPQHFDGAVFSGGPMNIMPVDGSSTPIFGSTVETSLAPNYRDTGLNTLNPPSAADWQAINGGDANGVHTGVNAQTLPTFQDNLLIASEAFYGDAAHNLNNPPSPPTGLYINGAQPNGAGGSLSSGLYIEGDVTMYAQGANAGSNGVQNFIFQVGGKQYDVTIDFNMNQTTVIGPGAVTSVYSGVPSGQPPGASGANGAIFVNNGDVTIGGGIKGNGIVPDPTIGATIHGAYTLGVPDYVGNSSHVITIKKSVQDMDPPSDPNSNDVLALWANDVRVSNNIDASVTIDALLLTGFYGECTKNACNDGTFLNLSCGKNSCLGGPGRTIYLNGSLIENVRGKLGTQFLGSTQCATGFCRSMSYDKRLGSKPPPFTPTTNKLQIVTLGESNSFP